MAAALNQTGNGQRGKMLTNICRLFDGNLRFAFDNQPIEVFLEQGLDSFGEISGDLKVQLLDFVEDGQRTVFEDRVGV
jgi:hypothetical protein